MKTEKRPWRGRILALSILVLGFSLAITSRFYYTARHPSAVEARFVDADKIVARFAPKDLSTVRPGLPARISVGETGYFGAVISQKDEDEFVIVLSGPNPDAPSQNTTCRVTVDASIPPEALKPIPTSTHNPGEAR